METPKSAPERIDRNAPIISVRNLTLGYGDEVIIEKVSFDVYNGEIFGILGRSGCGKTTLFKAMIGLIEPWSGEIIVEGEPLALAAYDGSKASLRRIGVLFQSGALFTSMTIAENVAFPLRMNTNLPNSIIERLVKIKLAEVGLAGYERLMPAELSGGMQKRAALARAMALDPQILFFDEPSAGLDPVTSAELDQTILKINRTLGTTIIIVTHELASIFSIAARVIMLDRDSKNIIAQGSPLALRDHSTDSRVQDFFRRSPEAREISENARLSEG